MFEATIAAVIAVLALYVINRAVERGGSTLYGVAAALGALAGLVAVWITAR